MKLTAEEIESHVLDTEKARAGYVMAADVWWLEHIDKTHDPEMHAHPSLSEYMVWIGKAT